MIKRITIAAIKRELGLEELPSLHPHQAFLLVYGAAEWISVQALKDRKCHGTDRPSIADMRKLSKLISK
jgi:hypothetical protein